MPRLGQIVNLQYVGICEKIKRLFSPIFLHTFLCSAQISVQYGVNENVFVNIWEFQKVERSINQCFCTDNCAYLFKLSPNIPTIKGVIKEYVILGVFRVFSS